ncbi:ATP/GTP-binding protein [Curtobacterium sp. MCBD17_008]|uniref:ATP/GTP-binding protein n=1 Tax=Curtobacterium sp. MCBD17_008 TaxID=2175656 RepID=UPI0021ABBC7E|nr:ATP/GTP-binding protein [Curtobacterium sp. MCBD17_008]
MASNSTPMVEQHIAVFGGSGSGKTVLLSSFYGSAQEPSVRRSNRFAVTAEDRAQGRTLHRNYLGMRDGDTVPSPTRFASTSYRFVIEPSADSLPKGRSRQKAMKPLRIVWHDYPGEWFEEDPSSADEAARRVETFRSLLSADVAVLLVDGQLLAEHAGEEERYLKALITDFHTGLYALRDDVLEDGKRLTRFPRIWTLALSKADLLPDIDVEAFRELVIGKAGGELDELRDVLQSFVQDPDALDVGEDFLLLSSAKFEPGNIDVTTRTGVDLLLPITAMLPFERFAKWATTRQRGAQVAEQLLKFVGPVVGFLATSRYGKSPLVGAAAGWIGGGIGSRAVSFATKRVAKIKDEAVAEQEFTSRVLARFAEDLDRGVEQRVLRRGES